MRKTWDVCRNTNVKALAVTRDIVQLVLRKSLQSVDVAYLSRMLCVGRTSLNSVAHLSVISAAMSVCPVVNTDAVKYAAVFVAGRPCVRLVLHLAPFYGPSLKV